MHSALPAPCAPLPYLGLFDNSSGAGRGFIYALYSLFEAGFKRARSTQHSALATPLRADMQPLSNLENSDRFWYRALLAFKPLRQACPGLIGLRWRGRWSCFGPCWLQVSRNRQRPLVQPPKYSPESSQNLENRLVNSMKTRERRASLYSHIPFLCS